MVDTEDWITDLYNAQKASREATERGKRTQIKKQYDRFSQQGPAKADAMLIPATLETISMPRHQNFLNGSKKTPSLRHYRKS